MASKGRKLARLLVQDSGDVDVSALDNAVVGDGDITTDKIADGAVTAAKLAAGAGVPTQSGHAGKYLKTDGTNASWETLVVPDEVIVSATEPTDKTEGNLWYNAVTNILYAADGTDYYKVSAEVPVINSVTGTLYGGMASSLTLSGLGFLTDDIVVNFTQASDGIDVDVTVTPTSDTAATVAVPSSVYDNVTGGNVVYITVTNSDSMTSAASSVTAVGLPSGGTITVSGGYRYHTFTSSGSFVVPSGYSASASYLVVAGGGAGGTRWGGGGGAGGYRTGSLTLSAGTGTVTVGGGGSASTSDNTSGGNGGNSYFNGTTSTGGGGGGAGYAVAGKSGGSGGGGSGTAGGGSGGSGGSGTSGQGNSGGTGISAQYTDGGGGGGGASASGQSAQNANPTGTGGNGNTWLDGNTYAGGGGGSTNAVGGSGGGGRGWRYGSGWPDGTAGTPNTGGGGGGGVSPATPGLNGGSGVVIIRYAV